MIMVGPSFLAGLQIVVLKLVETIYALYYADFTRILRLLCDKITEALVKFLSSYLNWHHLWNLHNKYALQANCFVFYVKSV